jgi:hypothetical protein
MSGVVESPVLNAARDKHSQLSIIQDKEWISAVRSKAFSACRNIGERIEIQRIFTSFGEPDINQPMFIRNRELISLSDMKRRLIDEGEFYIRLNEESDNAFEWRAAEKLSVLHGLIVEESRIFPLFAYTGELKVDSDLRELINNSSEPLFVFLKSIVSCMGPDAEVSCEYHQRSGYKEDYIDVFISAKPMS